MASTENGRKRTDGYSKFNDDFCNLEGAYAAPNTRNPSINVDLQDEYPCELGSTHSLGREEAVELQNCEGNSPNHGRSPAQSWEMNYHEAAIFLEEGENNEKFNSHPKDAEALPAYLLVHNSWYYGLDVFTSILLLLLAFVEEPAVPLFKLPVGAHGSIELLCLLVIGGELALKLRWIGWKTLLSHKRTMLKGVTLVIMFIEAVTVVIRQSSHFRVTRALRPIFIVDTKHCGEVRRFIRQIFQSLPPILDMMGLLLLFVSIYSLLGFFLFSSDPRDKHFTSLEDSFISLFVLLTTAKCDDAIIFKMLAVVYEAFTKIEREKFKKLLLHKRKACQHAFRLLVTKQEPNKVGFKHFKGLMRYYAPNKSQRDVMLMYKQLNSSGSDGLTLDEFYVIYETNELIWEAQFSKIPWFHSTWEPIQVICRYCNQMSNSVYFEYSVCFVIVGNLIAMIIRTSQFDPNDLESSARLFCASWDTILFLALYALEALIKVLGLGITRYFASGWNLFDFIVTLLPLLGVLLLSVFPSFTYVVLLRPLRLIRLFKAKKRYRDIFGTVVILSPLMCSVAVVMLVMYYFFAIVGMELFAGYDMRNCCKNTTVEEFYRYGNSSNSLSYYYLNSFENLLTSGVTLFELTVVNNWFIVMNGYVSVAHSYSRIYFITFYLFTMVVLTIVVASVLQSFRFRIHYKRQISKRDEEKMLHEEVHLKWDEVQSWIQEHHLSDALKNDIIIGGTTTFIGCRPRNKDVLQRRMYKSEIEEWMREAKQEEKRNQRLNLDEEHIILSTDHVIMGATRDTRTNDLIR
ncbi:hypothetical protein RUM43_010911 [Polyplax serrata]|uniref:Ion transport domain-containing protein n=1 Tax=Polyplax serrata TaxID=468196 RepID=A0AAN8NL41_POLSC